MNIRVFDNGGTTVDRYTVVYLDTYDSHRDIYGAVGMSSDPFHPQGFGQHMDVDAAWVNMCPDQETSFSDLPVSCRRLVSADLKDIADAD